MRTKIRNKYYELCLIVTRFDELSNIIKLLLSWLSLQNVPL